MFYAVYRNNNKIIGKLYTLYEDYSRDTFSPLTEQLHFIPFRVFGKTYHDKKQCVLEQAIEWSNSSGYSQLSYGELAVIADWFNRQGSRFGLLSEFRENGIC